MSEKFGLPTLLTFTLAEMLDPVTKIGTQRLRGFTQMAKSCKGLAMELVKCLSESDCVKVENRSFREYAKEKCPQISSECVGLRETYFNCKRGQVDMRARIRENKGY